MIAPNRKRGQNSARRNAVMLPGVVQRLRSDAKRRGPTAGRKISTKKLAVVTKNPQPCVPTRSLLGTTRHYPRKTPTGHRDASLENGHSTIRIIRRWPRTLTSPPPHLHWHPVSLCRIRVDSIQVSTCDFSPSPTCTAL